MCFAALGVQIMLPQQLPEPSCPYNNLQPCDVVVATAVWSTPHTFPQGLACMGCPPGKTCLPQGHPATLVACGGTPNPTLTWGSPPLSQGGFLCSPCVPESLSSTSRWLRWLPRLWSMLLPIPAPCQVLPELTVPFGPTGGAR